MKKKISHKKKVKPKKKIIKKQPLKNEEKELLKKLIKGRGMMFKKFIRESLGEIDGDEAMKLIERLMKEE